MATDFSALSASAQGQGVVSVAVATMLAGLATMLAGLNSADANVQAFAADLATEADNLSRACLQNVDGTAKPLGASEREPYLAAVGL